MAFESAKASEIFANTISVYDALNQMHGINESESASISNGGVLGGNNISISSANFSLSEVYYDSLLIASSNSMNLSGDMYLSAGASSVIELILVSSGLMSLESGSLLEFGGNSLKLGSFESMEVMNVDLFAEGEIHARSLDNLVISNTSMRTSGSGGADFIHLMAANELAINNLRFSDQVRQITMDAMTINLWNLDFPDGSFVNLNSQYGGLDGRYPNFGSKLLGRVNFIENIRYNNNLIDSRSDFDQFGSSISIGTLK